MEWSTIKTEPRGVASRFCLNEESCEDWKSERPIVIPLIARIVVVRVDMAAIIVAIGVEDVRIAVGNVWSAIHTTIP